MKASSLPFLLLFATACVDRSYNSEVKQSRTTDFPFVTCRASPSPDSPLTFRLVARVAENSSVVALVNKPAQHHEPIVELDSPRVRSVQGTRWSIDATGTLQSPTNEEGRENGDIDGIAFDVPNGEAASVSVNVLKQDPNHGIRIGHTLDYSHCTITDRSLLSKIPNPAAIAERAGVEDFSLGNCALGNRGYTLQATARREGNRLIPVALGLQRMDPGHDAISATIPENGIQYNAQRSIARDDDTGSDTYVILQNFDVRTEGAREGSPVSLKLSYGPRGTSAEKISGQLTFRKDGRDQELPCWSFDDFNVRALFVE